MVGSTTSYIATSRDFLSSTEIILKKLAEERIKALIINSLKTWEGYNHLNSFYVKYEHTIYNKRYYILGYRFFHQRFSIRFTSDGERTSMRNESMGANIVPEKYTRELAAIISPETFMMISQTIEPWKEFYINKSLVYKTPDYILYD